MIEIHSYRVSPLFFRSHLQGGRWLLCVLVRTLWRSAPPHFIDTLDPLALNLDIHLPLPRNTPLSEGQGLSLPLQLWGHSALPF